MREPFYLTPERALRLVPTPEPTPVTPMPDPITRRGLPGSVVELMRDVWRAVWGRMK